MVQSQDLLKQIVATLHASEFFSAISGDKESRFWLTYQQIAKETDHDFLERYNGDLDVQLIFVSAVVLALFCPSYI